MGGWVLVGGWGWGVGRIVCVLKHFETFRTTVLISLCDRPQGWGFGGGCRVAGWGGGDCVVGKYLETV